ncbi:hypothetical protein [Streptomyces sp. AK02-01A]|uniref:hypothetical protein n=1 Tax=Streptomyces sp. AK02-01A TaxID=3028648 RepID=UPI0029B582FC|nr:hypothetical protein [Streptomyces sp. AK02-01A]MDX3854880.1 hypothetical protein [Streptomyces sp. AK02-01A]
MFLRTTSAAVLGLTALTLLTLPGCSNSPSATPGSSSPAATRQKNTTSHATPSEPLSSAALQKRLLIERDLGEGYTLKPQTPSLHDDVTVTGCPALEQLGGDAAAGGSLNFPRRAKAAFLYAGTSESEVSEELYSDTESKLSQGTDRIFDALTSCPSYQVVAGSTPVDIATQRAAAPQLGDEQWSLQMTYTVGGRTTIVKQTAIRTGTTVVLVAGSPGLVDTHIDKALAKARSAN